jgi:hypothetical protein
MIQNLTGYTTSYSGYRKFLPDVKQNVIGYRKLKFWLPPADLGTMEESTLCPFFSFFWFLALKEYKRFNKSHSFSLPKVYRVETSSILRKNVYNSAEKRGLKGLERGLEVQYIVFGCWPIIGLVFNPLSQIRYSVTREVTTTTSSQLRLRQQPRAH